MAEVDAIVGQTYNARQQRVYPKVVAQSFVVDDKVGGSTEEFNNVIKETISGMDELTPQKITLGINGSIVVRTENTVRNFLFLNGNGKIQFESENITDKDGNVKIFNDKIVVTPSSLNISQPIIAEESSLKINDIDTSVLSARRIDTSTLLLSDGLNVDSIDVSVLTVVDVANIGHVSTDRLYVDSSALFNYLNTTDASVSNILQANAIDTSVLNIENTETASAITALDSSTIVSDTLIATDASINNLQVNDITIPNVVLLKQVNKLPAPGEVYAEETVQYIGPTYHETSQHIQKYDFVRCIMEYEASEYLDSSAYLYTDFNSFEPTTTLNWLEDNDISPLNVGEDNSEYEFILSWDLDKHTYIVVVKDSEDHYVNLGGDIYDDPASPNRHIYCPYVWDENYIPSSDTDVVLTYSVLFKFNEYVWKPVR